MSGKKLIGTIDKVQDGNGRLVCPTVAEIYDEDFFIETDAVPSVDSINETQCSITVDFSASTPGVEYVVEVNRGVGEWRRFTPS